MRFGNNLYIYGDRSYRRREIESGPINNRRLGHYLIIFVIRQNQRRLFLVRHQAYCVKNSTGNSIDTKFNQTTFIIRRNRKEQKQNSPILSFCIGSITSIKKQQLLRRFLVVYYNFVRSVSARERIFINILLDQQLQQSP